MTDADRDHDAGRAEPADTAPRGAPAGDAADDIEDRVAAAAEAARVAAEENARPAQRYGQKEMWVEAQIRAAMTAGDFDNLPGAGKPIEGLGGTHDPDWWVKQLIQREQLSGLGPPALTLRTEDTAMDDRLDALHVESDVRRVLDDFNARVVNARRQLAGGPPVITPTRDVDAEVAAWQTRREERHRANREARARTSAERRADESPTRRRRWWSRRDDA